MLPKQKSYIPRFALILNTLHSLANEDKEVQVVTKDSMLNAEKLSVYFTAMAKKIKVGNTETLDAKKVLKKAEDKTTKDKVKDLIAINPEMSKQKIADMLNISRQMVYKYLKDE